MHRQQIGDDLFWPASQPGWAENALNLMQRNIFIALRLSMINSDYSA
jgi:hypothetical protein